LTKIDRIQLPEGQSGICICGGELRTATFVADDGRRPDIVRQEHIHTLVAEWSNCLRNLVNSGYDVADIGRDTLAIRERLPV
jgi:hypothetical protein